MKEIYLKEIRSFLSSLIAYIVMVTFLIVTGLFIWVFPSTNVFDQGQSSLDTLFYMAPWIFIFLISAITMKSFSEERKMGTIEFLVTKPVGDNQIILAKFLANLTLVVFALLPTLFYVYSVYQLGEPKGNLDTGATIGSYIGLVLLGACYTAVGLFSSALTTNQIVAFLLSMFLCFFLYIGFEQISTFSFLGGWNKIIQWLGVDFHYESIRRGVLDSRDALYFISVVLFFLGLTKLAFASRKW